MGCFSARPFSAARDLIAPGVFQIVSEALTRARVAGCHAVEIITEIDDRTQTIDAVVVIGKKSRRAVILHAHEFSAENKSWKTIAVQRMRDFCTAILMPAHLQHRLSAVRRLAAHKRPHTSPRRWRALYGETLALAEQRGLIAPISPAEQLFGPARRRRPWRK